MESKRYWVIYFQGAEAVKAGYAYQAGLCYRRIKDGDEYCGQLEVVRDDEDAQLVAVSYIPENRVEFIKAELAKHGFAGMQYIPESYCDENCMWDCRAEEVGSLPDYSMAENSETVYTTLLCGERKPLPEPKASKSVIEIFLTVHEERGEWINWWIECDDPEILLPDDEREIARSLRKYDVILVGNKWFSGKDAEKAVAECYRQYRKIIILDDKDKIVAEIYDKQTMYDCNDDLGGKYRWQSQSFGQVEHTFADVLESANDGETYKHNYKGW